MTPNLTRRSLPALLAAAAGLGAGSSRAADAPKVLNVGTGGAFTSIDPHYHNLTPNNVVSYHLFNGLMTIGPAYKPEPALATSWTATDDHTWEFKLRPNVVFSDGHAVHRRRRGLHVRARAAGRQQPVLVHPGHQGGEAGRDRGPADRAAAHVRPPTAAAAVPDAGADGQPQARGGRQHGRLQLGQGRHRHGAVRDGQRHPGRQDRVQAQRQVLGRAAVLGRGELPPDRQQLGPNRSLAGRRRGHRGTRSARATWRC